MHKRDELGQMLLTLGLLLQDRQRCPHGDGHQGRGCGGEDEWTTAIDHEIAQHTGCSDKRAGGTERLATGVNDQKILAPS